MIIFAHHEPIEPTKARWSAITRTLAAVAAKAKTVWFTPDKRERIAHYFEAELGAALPDALEIRTLPSVHKRLGFTFNGVFFRAFRKALAGRKADVLWLRSDKLAAYVAEKMPVHPPLVYEAHLVGPLWAQDRDASEAQVARLQKLENVIYAGAVGVAGITQGVIDEITSRYGFKGPTAVVPSAVDTKLFAPQWHGGGSTVVYVGTLQFWKGLDTLVHAIALTRGLHLRIVGHGSGEELARLQKEITDLRVGARVNLIGHVPQKELPALIADAACAVHPLPPDQTIAARFTSPLKLFEYMSMGLPIVASNLGSVREVLRDGVSARLFEAGSAHSLARALEEVCGNAVFARKLSQNAQLAAQQYSYDARADRLLELFDRVTR
ncbi:MAG: glycosyltransferase [Planctomycetes bacterium]|nr:glycosyltransferase [Planctomycetota bacterium]